MPRDMHHEFRILETLNNYLLHTQIIDVNKNGFTIKGISDLIGHFKFMVKESDNFLFTSFLNDVEDLWIEHIDVKDFYYEKDDDSVIDFCQITFFNNCRKKILKIVAVSIDDDVGLIDDSHEEIILASCIF